MRGLGNSDVPARVAVRPRGVLDRMYRTRDLASDARRMRHPEGGSRRLLARFVGLLIVVPLTLIVAVPFRAGAGHAADGDPAGARVTRRGINGSPYADISPALPHALIASEDNLFCEETFGFDFAAMRSQLDVWEEGKRPRGASTITMQTAKNLLLWPGRDPFRKAIEAWLTPQIALLWPKRRILEVYLNIVEFGPGIYGAEAAARWFFHKPAAELTPREAAQLVSVLPRPLVWVAAPPGPYVRERAGVIERRADNSDHCLAARGDWRGGDGATRNLP